jgi:hypothetical protein
MNQRIKVMTVLGAMFLAALSGCTSEAVEKEPEPAEESRVEQVSTPLVAVREAEGEPSCLPYPPGMICRAHEGVCYCIFYY